ncbi:MAG: MarR family transcriptional regulator [Clostridia bacterium]|nr:MarR family transcriptional regulator [Clostridia bacterium]
MDFKELLKDFMIDFPTRLAKFEQSALTAGLELEKGISISEIHIISKIGPDGSKKMNQIARQLGVTQPTLTAACDKLEAKGLIIRHRDPEDKRVVNVQLTSEGLIAYSFHQAMMDDLAERFIDGMSEEDMNKLSQKINQIYNYLSI